jgi:hypothetical protein
MQGAVGATQPKPTSSILKSVFDHVASGHHGSASIDPAGEAARRYVPNQCSEFKVSLLSIAHSGLSRYDYLGYNCSDALFTRRPV